MFHTYVDLTNDGKPFYVGMGDDNRIKVTAPRNKRYGHVANKHGMRREVVMSFDERQLAIDLEIKLIAEHHTFVDDPSYNGIGCNYTRGGEGCPCSEETRRKISESRKGKPAWNKGKPGKKLTEAQKQHLRELNSGPGNAMWGKTPSLGKKHTDETRAKMRKPHQCSRCNRPGHTKRTCNYASV